MLCQLLTMCCFTLLLGLFVCAMCVCVCVCAGKTMLAKAVAHHTTAAFIRVVGSEFVQKYLGEVSRVL